MSLPVQREKKELKMAFTCMGKFVKYIAWWFLKLLHPKLLGYILFAMQINYSQNKVFLVMLLNST